MEKDSSLCGKHSVSRRLKQMKDKCKRKRRVEFNSERNGAERNRVLARYLYPRWTST